MVRKPRGPAVEIAARRAGEARRVQRGICDLTSQGVPPQPQGAGPLQPPPCSHSAWFKRAGPWLTLPCHGRGRSGPVGLQWRGIGRWPGRGGRSFASPGVPRADSFHGRWNESRFPMSLSLSRNCFSRLCSRSDNPFLTAHQFAASGRALSAPRAVALVCCRADDHWTSLPLMW